MEQLRDASEDIPEGYETFAGYLRRNGVAWGAQRIAQARKLAAWIVEQQRKHIHRPGAQANLYRTTDLDEFMDLKG